MVDGRWSDLEWRRFPKDLLTKHRVDKLTYESMSWYFDTDQNRDVVADDFWYFFCPECTEIVREEYKTFEGTSIAILAEDWIANHPPPKPDRRPPLSSKPDRRPPCKPDRRLPQITNHRRGCGGGCGGRSGRNIQRHVYLGDYLHRHGHVYLGDYRAQTPERT